MLLVAKGLPTLTRYPRRNIGRLIVPRSANKIPETPRAGYLWAADNDAYNGFHEDRFVAMLDKLVDVPGCLFVTAPDVVGDAAATRRSFHNWTLPLLRRRLPIAYVGQDGATADEIPWHVIRAFFIGGSTEWKLGPEAAALAAEAKRHGKWVHMGRVNTWRRIEYANAIGCDSIDGTAVSMYTDTYLPRFSELADAAPQGTLTGAHP